MSFRDLLFLLPLACTAATLTGCSSEPAPAQGTGSDDLAGGSCNVVPKTVTGLTAFHLDPCTPIDYPDNPPAGGNHYYVWAAYQSYPFVVPRGFWVHDLEHGGIVYTYNCPDGCDDEVAQMQALIDALPVDPTCLSSLQQPPRRVVLTPDPLLNVRWAASAWGHTIAADCLDTDRFTQFYLNHFGQGPEVFDPTLGCPAGDDFDGMPPCQ